MSHVATIDLDIRDLDALADACSALGLELRRGQTTYAWYGTSVDDTPLPPGRTVADLGTCAHAIRLRDHVEGRDYEIGVVRRADGRGYTLEADSWGPGRRIHEACGGNSLRGLREQYAANVARRQLLRQGYRVQLHRDARGVLRVEGVKA